MTNAELSLKVAMIMYPEERWSLYEDDDCPTCCGDDFDYTRNHCAFDMSVWLAINGTLLTQKSIPYLLRMDNAIFQLAMAILKTGKTGDSDE